MSFGARVLKTGIAVTLSLFLSGLFDITPPVIAAVAAIFAMQPSIYRSWRHLLEQLQTNTLGAALALLAGMFFSSEPIAIGLVCIAVIMICLKMKMEESIGLTLVTVVAVMEASGHWDFALNRFLLILIGIGSASLINIIFFPPKPREQFLNQMQSVFSKMSLLLRTAISDEIKENVFRDEKQELEKAMKSLSDKYQLFEEELKKLRRAKYSQTRNLVIYKQMLYTLHKGMEVLDAVEEHYFPAARTPETDQAFDQHLERLIKYHEHVLLKFDDKLKPESLDGSRFEEENDRFMNTLLECGSEYREGKLRLSVVAGAMYDYGYQTGRLDKLLEQYNRSSDDKEPLETLTSWIKK
ncbi:aromatic acid exporter family protein [Paenibacillus sp. JMULE4]|uniref:FUSC family protein n=1 Tax=Paenibacillus TaxID=44249 RepID=UPI0015765E8A|nr:aromatic acid exporter family protein [Paenibacillus sp. JMULE4]NTZ20386.1 aromatic acid exporter family protein [Paenibacillus sp. JMULE4]